MTDDAGSHYAHVGHPKKFHPQRCNGHTPKEKIEDEIEDELWIIIERTTHASENEIEMKQNTCAQT